MTREELEKNRKQIDDISSAFGGISRKTRGNIDRADDYDNKQVLQMELLLECSMHSTILLASIVQELRFINDNTTIYKEKEQMI